MTAGCTTEPSAGKGEHLEHSHDTLRQTLLLSTALLLSNTTLETKSIFGIIMLHPPTQALHFQCVKSHPKRC